MSMALQDNYWLLHVHYHELPYLVLERHERHVDDILSACSLLLTLLDALSRLEFTWATDEQKERLFVSFYSREDVPQWLGKDGEAAGSKGQQLQEQRLGEQAKEFVRLLNDSPVPMAQLQGLLMKHKSDPESALRSCESLRLSSTANDKQD